jgi:hypothetical protein
MLSRASRAADPLGLGRQVRELIPITRVECTEYAAAIFILHQPKLGVEVASILLACQDALEAWQDRPVIEHEILLPIERLVKIVTHDTLWHIFATDCPCHAPTVCKTKFLGSKGTIASPLKHIVPLDPAHVCINRVCYSLHKVELNGMQTRTLHFR